MTCVLFDNDLSQFLKFYLKQLISGSLRNKKNNLFFK